MKQPVVYLLASKKNGTLYVGVTSDLKQRVWQHKQHLMGGFTQKYNVVNLVFYEVGADIYAAICREKQIKKWRREWKIKLIEQFNPEWRDLYDDL